MRSILKDAIKAEETAIAERAYDAEVSEALDAAQLAISEYYSGDREWAERWLLTAVKANQVSSRDTTER